MYRSCANITHLQERTASAIFCDKCILRTPPAPFSFMQQQPLSY
jgi:hypothetical protein